MCSVEIIECPACTGDWDCSRCDGQGFVLAGVDPCDHPDTHTLENEIDDALLRQRILLP